MVSTLITDTGGQTARADIDAVNSLYAPDKLHNATWKILKTHESKSEAYSFHDKTVMDLKLSDCEEVQE